MWQTTLVPSVLALLEFVPLSSAATFPAQVQLKRNDGDTQQAVSRRGFPVPNPTESYWQSPPHRIANHRTTPELPDPSTTLDYIIIGSGVTGAATAHKLLLRDPSLSILMLEARTAASAASGRNGGHCRPSSYSNIQTWVDKYGEDEAVKLAKMEQDCVNDVAQFVKEYGANSTFREVETGTVYWTKEAFDTAVKQVEYQQQLEARRPNEVPDNKRTIYKGEEARTYWGWSEILGAITFKAATQNPYLTVCHILEVALEKGLNLQTNTTALSLEQIPAGVDGDARWRVVTDRGTVKAAKVVLATNAYTNALHPGFAKTNFLLPTRSQVSAVHPEAWDASNPVFHRSTTYPDLHSGNNYIVVRAPGDPGEGDVIYGGSRQVSGPLQENNVTDDSVVHDFIKSNLQRVGRVAYGYKNWGETTRLVKDWSGITCDTPDGLPLVGAVPEEEGLWAAVCMNGHGMAWAYRSAEALVQMMESGVGEEGAPEWFPKEAFRASRAWELPGWEPNWPRD
ncbi:hypothetical protein MCOR25_004136 [Pyricularia grisea]|uniref:FAD dependent oxidoreductase domain-containing protein n=1 Tax=Pyricularia grisea TaxID=148305 RepID=A0A6P8AQ38_PYRGI|nr:hypothetical protein PgNI_11259 [Pyricularia grisea]KAI6370593.1 hypothetical protein MCOR25_004136 [Pyricularia grisea]TLD04151.1 hypothetical protein PgNI_11259 [Pyricularia grisea]